MVLALLAWLGLPVMLHKSLCFPEFLWLFDHLVASLLDAKLVRPELLCWVKSEQRRGCVRVCASEKAYTLRPSNRTRLHTCMHACERAHVSLLQLQLLSSPLVPLIESFDMVSKPGFSLTRFDAAACLLVLSPPPHSLSLFHFLSLSLSLSFSIGNWELYSPLSICVFLAECLTLVFCLHLFPSSFHIVMYISLFLRCFRGIFWRFCVPGYTVPALPVCKLVKYIAKNIMFQLWT